MTAIRLVCAPFGVLAALAGCSAPAPGAPPDQSFAPDMEIIGSATEGLASIGPVALAAGEEKTVCITVRLSNTQPIIATHLTSTLAPGSHHLIVYRSTATTESPTPTECMPFGGILGGSNIPIFITQRLEDELIMPAAAGLPLDARQMVRLEAHYIDASPNPLMGSGQFHAAGIAQSDPAAAALKKVDLSFWGTAKIAIPPHQTFDSGPQFQSAIAGVTGFMVTTHQHRLGTRFRIWVSKKAGDFASPPVADSMGWQDAPVYEIDPAVTFDGGSGLTYQCAWNNTTDATVDFGESALQEMCFLWMYYYPSHGFDVCIDGTCLNRK